MRFLLIFLSVFNICIFPSLIVEKKLSMEISIDRDGLPALFYIDPPANICEGFNNEIIVYHKTFFEVFDQNGRFLKRIGARGEGPGDFSNIMFVIAKDMKYFLLDYPNSISIFDYSFRFNDRKRYGGSKCSPFVQSFDIYKNRVYCAQNYYFDENRKDSILVYSFKGKIANHFFDRRNGWKDYPFLSLIAGRLKIIKNKIFFVYYPIPRIYQLDLNGRMNKKIKFGDKWWKRIMYNANEFKKKERKSSTKAYADLLTSGDRIIKLLEWRGNLLVHIIKDPAEEYAKHGFVLFSRDLEQKTKFVSLKEYQFSGVGKYIYFSRELEDNDLKNKMKIEVLKCDLKY